MGRKIKFNRFNTSTYRRSRFNTYMDIVSILPEYAQLVKTI